MSIEIVAPADIRTQNYRRVFVMMEDRLGHYPGFREALAEAFKLTPAHADGGAPGYFRAASGREYEVVFTSRSQSYESPARFIWRRKVAMFSTVVSLG